MSHPLFVTTVNLSRSLLFKSKQTNKTTYEVNEGIVTGTFLSEEELGVKSVLNTGVH